MKPTPINSIPEQYNIADGSDWLRVLPVAPGGRLDKWCFVKRDEDTVVLEKHIGGEKYQAKHTTPDSIPYVVYQKLTDAGYDVEHPHGLYIVVEEPDGDGTVTVPVTEDRDPLWDELPDWVAEKAKRYMGINDE